MSLITPRLFSEVADGVTCNGLGDCVSLLRADLPHPALVHTSDFGPISSPVSAFIRWDEKDLGIVNVIAIFQQLR
jgi:hypothetical protein